MGAPLKWIFSPGLLEKSFGAQYDQLGKSTIQNIKWGSSSARIMLRYQRDTTELDNFGVSFSKKGKIMGFNSKQPEFQYKKDQPIYTDHLTEKIDSIVRYKYLAAGFSGCVAVVDGDRVVYENCYGMANQETQAPLTPATRFDLASCSKAFTAMSVMLLQEQGKLRITDNAAQYLPELAVYKGITIEHLLTHTSGIPDYMELLEKHWDTTRFATNDDVLQLLSKHHPKKEFSPGTNYSYSNTGYVLLAIIAGRVSGQPFEVFLKESIFDPLGMVSTRIYNTRRSADEKLENTALGYIPDIQNHTLTLPDSLPDYSYVRYMDAITGDGVVNSNLKDMVIWDKALRTNQLASAETMAAIFTPYKLKNGESTDYGYGWEVKEKEGNETLVFHSGSWPGYVSYVLRFKDRPVTIIALSNNEYLFISYLAHRIARLFNQ